jgi:prevent-host-death family protein
MQIQRKELVMIDLGRGIQSLSNFKRKTADLLRQLKETGDPVVLTINGKAELVVQDAASYQRLMEIVERAEEMEALRISVEEMKAGKGVPVEEMLADMRQNLAVAKAKGKEKTKKAR